MKKILITGATGFAGSHLTNYLSSFDYELFGTYFTEPTDLPKITLKKIDLTKKDEVESLVSEIRPDFIYHLAAFPAPSDSFKDPELFILNNTASQITLMEAVRKVGLSDTRFLVVSSGEIYGLVEEKNLPINEEVPLSPTSPYAVSKIAQDFLGLQYFNSYQLPIIRVRPFNHVGPGLSPKFAPSAFARQIAEIEKKKKDPIMYVGNLEAKRDFTDVLDMVKAYHLVLEKGKPGDVYNIGSGKSYRIKEILDMLLSFSSEKITVEIDENLLRPTDIHEIRCDNSKITQQTGWQPQIPIEESLRNTLDYWRNMIQ